MVDLKEEKRVFPTESTTYTITATNEAGKDVDTTRVNVDVGVQLEKPVIKYFKAGDSTLSWDVSGATSVTIEPGIGKVALRGTKKVSPRETTTYTLMATNDAGSIDDTVEVLVGPGVTEIDRILGTVTYRGTPVEGIPIVLIASSECDVTKVDQRTYTDAQGRYFFLGISPGSYRIAINGWGDTAVTVEPYEHTCTWELEKKASSALTLDWTLHKTDLQITFPIEDTSIDSTSPTFRWVAYPYATRYEIVLIQVSPSRETIEWGTPTESTSFTSETPLTPGARYKLIVWAWGSTGQIAYGNVYFTEMSILG
jgi:PKD repeat protein